MSPRAPLALVSLVLIAGALLLMLLVVIGGAVDKNPVNQFYFLQADTSAIPGAPATSRWTFWNTCGDTNGRNTCPHVHPAYAFDPQKNFGTTTGVPASLVEHSKKYYFETRFMFAFEFIALFFTACALILGVVALLSRVASFLTSGLCSVGLTFQAVSAALMTAAYVQGRDAFRAAGTSANLGRYNFGFMWAAVACLFLATVFLCAGGAASSSSGKRSSRGRFGRRQKSTRSRGSFIDKETAVDGNGGIDGDRSSFVRDRA